jgi:tetratricopeptide (TPR) repeat protein
MHRSGTSAITRGLQVLGVDLGERLMPSAADNNETGFWEDIDLNALNIEILLSLGSDWNHVSPIAATDMGKLLQSEYFSRAVELLQDKTRDVSIFGIKDPRVAKLLPFWKAVFEHCQLETSYVIALRHPLSVAKSLLRRDGVEIERSYFLWLTHVLNSVAGTVGDNRVLVDYDLLMYAPEHELARMAQGLALQIDQEALQKYRHEFLVQGLRHTKYSMTNLSGDESCPQIVREMYAELLDVAADRQALDSELFQSKQDQWAKEIESFKPAFSLIDKLPIQKEQAAPDINDDSAAEAVEGGPGNELPADRAEYELAAKLLEAGRSKESQELLELLAAKGSSCWEVYNDLAVAYFNAGELERAEPYFQKGMSVEGGAGVTAGNYASLLVATGRINEALAVLGSIVREQPHHESALTDINVILSNINPIDPDTWLKLVDDLRGKQWFIPTREAMSAQRLLYSSSGNTAGASRKTQGAPGKECRIYQIYYDETTKDSVDPCFIPLDNMENARPDWCEYWLIRKILMNNTFDDDTYLGFFSPKFLQKTGMEGYRVLELVRHFDGDVLSLSPYFDQGAMYPSPFAQGEFNHPGLIKTTQELLSLLKIDLDLESLVCDQSTTIFCNYFVARYSFWKRWFAYAERIFNLCEGPDCELKRRLTTVTKYREGTQYAMKIFIMERLVTIVMEELGIKARVGINVADAPQLLQGPKENLSGLLLCDALKGQYRNTGLAVFKELFTDIRKVPVAAG